MEHQAEEHHDTDDQVVGRPFAPSGMHGGTDC